MTDHPLSAEEIDRFWPGADHADIRAQFDAIMADHRARIARAADASRAAWPVDCHGGIEGAIAEFKRTLPGWWFSLGECQVSCDASCAPTALSGDIALIPRDDRFNSGFHADLPQPSTLAAALRCALAEALSAKLWAAATPPP